MIPSEEIQAPDISRDDVIALPYDSSTFLCPDSLTRWRHEQGNLYRDFQGEIDWDKMSDYVGKTYKEVFIEEYNHAATKHGLKHLIKREYGINK